MRLHPEAQALLARLAALGDPPIETSTPEAVRALRASRIPAPSVELAEIRDVVAGGVPARLYRPDTQGSLGLFLYLHGGGWVLGSVETHDHVARALSAESGCAVLSLGYRLAPEHPFPTGLDDAFAAATWAHEHAAELGCDPARLAIGGDSAGANLAAVVTQSGQGQCGQRWSCGRSGQVALTSQMRQWRLPTFVVRILVYSTGAMRSVSSTALWGAPTARIVCSVIAPTACGSLPSTM